MIRVLHVTFDLKLGGTQQVIRQIVSNINGSEFESHIICLDGDLGELGELIRKENVAQVSVMERLPGFDSRLIKQLRKYISCHGIDIVHCHQYTPYFYGVLAALGLGVKVIFTEHGRFYPDIVSRKRQLVNQGLALFTNAITAISRATADALVNIEKLPRRKVEVIYNGINPQLTKSDQDSNDIEEFRKRYNLESHHFIYGTISRLEPIKNQQLMIRAFSVVLQKLPDSRLILIGDGAIRKELEKLVSELGIDNQVIFTGFITDPQKYIQLMDVFLLPSFSEGTSMTLLEAMSYSTPAIVTNVGGSPEIILHGKTGLVTESDNLQELTQAMFKLYENPSLRIEFGASAFERFHQEFTDIKMIASYQTLYSKLADS